MNNIKKILTELYEIEPNLKSREEEVLTIIQTMLEVTPQIEISDEFKRELRERVLRQISKKSYTSSGAIGMVKIIGTFLAGGLATYAALQFAVLPDFFTQKKDTIDYTPIIKQEEERAFGDLKELGLGTPQSGTKESGFIQNSQITPSLDSIQQEPQSTISYKGTENDALQADIPQIPLDVEKDNDNDVSSELASDISSLRSMGDGVVSPENTTEAISTITPMPSEGGESIPGVAPGYPGTDYMPEYIPTIYNYILYDVELPKYDSKIDVYKVEKSKTSFSDIFGGTSILQNDFIDLSVLSRTTVESISFYEDITEGYQVNYDLNAGSIFISSRYDKWLFDYQTRLSEKDMLSESELVKIADSFIKKFSIDTSIYGKPLLSYNWQRDYSLYSDKSSFYFPDTQNIVYPQKLDGIEVYDQGGMPVGINVSINVGKKKVTSLGPIQKQVLTKSQYDTESSREKILSSISTMYSPGYVGENVKKIDIALTNPKIVYMKNYSLVKGKDQEYGEYLVPAIKFEIKDVPKDYYGMQTIVVPIVKDFFQTDSWGVVEPALGGGVSAPPSAIYSGDVPSSSIEVAPSKPIQ